MFDFYKNFPKKIKDGRFFDKLVLTVRAFNHRAMGRKTTTMAGTVIVKFKLAQWTLHRRSVQFTMPPTKNAKG